MRNRLPDERSGVTHHFVIHSHDSDHDGYITTGQYDDGTLGEVFLKLSKQGGTISGLCDAWAISVSMLLQTGTPLEEICTKFRSSRFEPGGRTDNPQIRVASSPLDYISRWLGIRYLGWKPDV
jgi:ribonucleoside-diphosphate reductase alpha chain